MVWARHGDFEEAIGKLDRLTGGGTQVHLGELRNRMLGARQKWREAAESQPPADAKLRGQSQAGIGAWGRAYDAMSPSANEFQSPEDLVFFAEVSWKAGEWGAARGALDRVGAGVDPSGSIKKWNADMHWAN